MTPLFLRYQLPAPDAARLAARWLALRADRLSVGRLEQEATEAATPGRLDIVDGDALPGAVRLAPWLGRIDAPGRTFLEVDLDALGLHMAAAARKLLDVPK